jgi:hypothetical protein
MSDAEIKIDANSFRRSSTGLDEGGSATLRWELVCARGLHRFAS